MHALNFIDLRLPLRPLRQSRAEQTSSHRMRIPDLSHRIFSVWTTPSSTKRISVRVSLLISRRAGRLAQRASARPQPSLWRGPRGTHAITFPTNEAAAILSLTRSSTCDRLQFQPHPSWTATSSVQSGRSEDCFTHTRAPSSCRSNFESCSAINQNAILMEAARLQLLWISNKRRHPFWLPSQLPTFLFTSLSN